jgi:hypothetical protein
MSISCLPYNQNVFAKLLENFGGGGGGQEDIPVAIDNPSISNTSYTNTFIVNIRFSYTFTPASSP